MFAKITVNPNKLFSTSSQRSYSAGKKYNNPILENFVSLPGEEVKQEIKTIEDKGAVLKKEIAKLNSELNNLEYQYYDLYKKCKSLKEPFVFYERACSEIEKKSLEIMNAITSALTRGTTTVWIGTGYGHIEGLFGLFHLLFSTYNINLETEREYGQGEMYVSWKCKIPSTYSQPTLISLEDNPKFNEIAVAFDKQLALSYKRAEDKIAEDLSQLDKELIQPILQGDLKAFTFLKPCPVAYERILEIAENNNICLAIQEKVIVASNKSINLGAKL